MNLIGFEEDEEFYYFTYEERLDQIGLHLWYCFKTTKDHIFKEGYIQDVFGWKWHHISEKHSTTPLPRIDLHNLFYKKLNRLKLHIAMGTIDPFNDSPCKSNFERCKKNTSWFKRLKMYVVNWNCTLESLLRRIDKKV
jgi:hypothetical protein